MPLHLTEQSIRGAKVRPGQLQTDYWDTVQRGLGLRVSGERKTFVVMYYLRARKRRLNLGTWPEVSLKKARELAKSRLGMVADGKDPAAEKAEQRKEERDAKSFEVIAEHFLEDFGKLVSKGDRREKTFKEYKRIVANVLDPMWGRRRAAEISREEVSELVEGYRDKGSDTMGNRVLAVVNIIYNWALERPRPLVTLNPAHKLKKAEEGARQRVLSYDEVRRIWNSLDEQSAKIAAFFKLCLLTGQRRGEILGMRWDELTEESDGWWWTIPGARTKNHLTHRVPLTPMAQEVLSETRSKTPSDIEFVFPGPGGKQPIGDPQGWIDLVKSAAGLSPRPHDIRKTVATYLAKHKVDDATISRILNHGAKDDVTHRHYNFYAYDAEKRQALTAWETVLTDVIAGRLKGMVVALRPHNLDLGSSETDQFAQSDQIGLKSV